MKLVVRKNNLGAKILYKVPTLLKKRRQYDFKNYNYLKIIFLVDPKMQKYS